MSRSAPLASGVGVRKRRRTSAASSPGSWSALHDAAPEQPLGQRRQRARGDLLVHQSHQRAELLPPPPRAAAAAAAAAEHALERAHVGSASSAGGGRRRGRASARRAAAGVEASAAGSWISEMAAAPPRAAP